MSKPSPLEILRTLPSQEKPDESLRVYAFRVRRKIDSERSEEEREFLEIYDSRLEEAGYIVRKTVQEEKIVSKELAKHEAESALMRDFVKNTGTLIDKYATALTKREEHISDIYKEAKELFSDTVALMGEIRKLKEEPTDKNEDIAALKDKLKRQKSLGTAIVDGLGKTLGVGAPFVLERLGIPISEELKGAFEELRNPPEE